jgi:hypothetical protein
MNNNFDFKVNKVVIDVAGNYIILVIKTMETEITLVNIYGPNRDDPLFYENIQDLVLKLGYSNIIMVGDWNLVLNPALDYCNYKSVNNVKAQERVLAMTTDLELSDIWREINPETLRYTWRRTNPQQQARLDFFLVSETLMDKVKHCDILHGYRTDHSLITLELEFTKEAKRNSYWKFNKSLLYDRQYVLQINEVINNTIEQYAATPYNREKLNSIPLEEIQFTISDQLFLDVLLMEIRSKSIAFSSHKKKINTQKECSLEKEIEILEQKRIKTQQEIQDLHDKTEQLAQLREQKMQGILLRSKAKYAAQGERVTKYYCNMEKRHYTSKQMFRLVTKDGLTLTNTDDMLNETKEYYKQLYAKRIVQNVNLKEYITTLPKLNDDEADSLEGEITLEEASKALKNMANDKSPGSDGFTAAFFKFFWKRLGHFVVRSLNEGFARGEMSITQKEGIITCLPKGDKPREFLKNWRPISLLNVTYKIGSSCIANRMKTVLADLINDDQTGFIPGRYIGDNLRCIYDIIHYLNTHNKPGLLISIDFEKAFDSIDWSFMENVLREVGFKEDMCRWISAFYNNIKASVIVNGCMSQSVPVERGCRQGDPISPYLFVLCAKILACKIREDMED